MEDVTYLLNATPANIVVVTYDVWMDDPFHNSYQVAHKVNKAVALLNEGEECWKTLWTKCGAVLGKTGRVDGLRWLMKNDDGPHRSLCCEVLIRKSNLSTGGSVRLALVASQKDARNYPMAWKRDVRRAVAQFQVRYICGVFSREKEDTEKLLEDLNIGQGALLFQPFWTKHAEGDADGGAEERGRAAVAARFDMAVTENVRRVRVYPAYFVVRGPLQNVSVPHIAEHPYWPGRLFPHGSGIKNGLGRLVDVPQLRQDQSPVDLPDPLPMRQKVAPLKLWRKGVHQLLLWLGRNRPSKSSQKKNRWRAWQHRGSKAWRRRAR